MLSSTNKRADVLGRTVELARLDALLAEAREQVGGALRLLGAPGVGKTTLLAAAVSRAEGAGPAVIRAEGVELEAGIPWAGLEPLLAATELDGSVAADAELDPTVLPRELARRLAVLAPVLVVVDDVQWLDASSRVALAYLARRAPALGYGLLAAWSQRGAEPDPWPGADEVALEGLDPVSALTLARRQGLAPAVATAFVEAAGGRALVLIDGPQALTPLQRAGRAPLPDPLPVGPRLQAAYAERIVTLPAATREALLMAAAGAPPELVTGALEPAEDAGLIVLGTPRVEGLFAHPLIRAAVYHAAAPSARRDAHRRIAAHSDGARRTWQQALAAAGPDADLADALEASALASARSGAPGTAASMLERAARLSPDPEQVSARLLQAAQQGLSAGRGDWASSLLEEVLPQAVEPGARADVQALRGVVMYQTGRSGEAAILLEHEASMIANQDPGRASALLCHAGIARMGPGPIPHLAALAQKAERLAPGNPLAAVLEAEALVSLGRHEPARRMLAALDPILGAWEPTAPGHEILAIAALSRLYLGDFDVARSSLIRLVEANRAVGAMVPLVLPLAVLATLHLRTGRLEEAWRCAEESADIAETGLAGGFVGTLALAAVAMVAAHRGDEASCRVASDRMLVLGRVQELPATLACAEQALGLLALSGGDAKQAVDHFERALRHTAAHGTSDPGFLFTHADLVEGLVRCGREEEARGVLDELDARAQGTGGAWALAAVERCRALLADAGEIPTHLAAALACHARTDMPLEAARTRLTVGEALRRARQPAAARSELSAAHACFAAAGARLWTERAARELAAAGGATASVLPAELTPREADVCQLVAAGASNRGAASALFLSSRTVEHHLRTAFRKLGVHSRSELAALWARAEPVGADER